MLTMYKLSVFVSWNILAARGIDTLFVVFDGVEKEEGKEGCQEEASQEARCQKPAAKKPAAKKPAA